MILIIYAHPYPSHSRANRALLDALHALPDVRVRSLYELYPDFDIDVQAEQAALTQADLVVWLHPMYWYSVPAMLKHWFDVVLLRGWAYGAGTALKGKHCLWVTTTGAANAAFSEQGSHHYPFDAFTPAVRQTAQFCGMLWEEPFVLHGAHTVSDAVLADAAQRLRQRLIDWQNNHSAFK